MLNKFTSAFGVSGFENEIRDIIIEHNKNKCTSYEIDNMGNVIFYKKGINSYHNKIMLTAHMDEVGFIISGITEEGALKFKTVGGIDTRIIQNTKVIIGENRINGVIGAKPAHMSKEYQPVKVNELVIDIGCKSKLEAESIINIGDYAMFNSIYTEFGDGLVKAKALDDRVGCYILSRLMDNQYPNDVYFVFTVQEEVGCRGASIVAERIKPDYTLVVEGTTCSDVPHCTQYNYSTVLRDGVALSMLDNGSYSDRELTKFLYDTAVNNNVPVQYKRVTSGGNDANVLQVSGNGYKVAALSVPCRYIHSPVSVASFNDINSCYDLLYNALSKENNLWSC